MHCPSVNRFDGVILWHNLDYESRSGADTAKFKRDRWDQFQSRGKKICTQDDAKKHLVIFLSVNSANILVHATDAKNKEFKGISKICISKSNKSPTGI